MIDKGIMGGSGALLILSLLSQREMYGYEIVSELASLSDNAFRMQEGTLYPLLHTLEQDGHIVSFVREVNRRFRRYYRVTDSGLKLLEDKRRQWETVNKLLDALSNPGALNKASAT